MSSYPSKPVSSSRADVGGGGVSGGSAPRSSTRKPGSSKSQAMVGELELVKSNIILTNVRRGMRLGND